MIYEYATKSWPIIKGCANDLPCAARCWAKRQIHRLAFNPNQQIAEFHQGLTACQPRQDPRWTGTVKLNEAHLEDPLHWRKPEIVAVAYHGDIGLATDEQLDRIFAVMALCPQHQFLLLTKRPTRLHGYFGGDCVRARISAYQWEIIEDRVDPTDRRSDDIRATALDPDEDWPLPNVWLGTSVSNQAEAEERLTELVKIPAAHRWLSLEPMVRPVDLTPWLLTGIQWVVLGGESGPNARPMHPDWVRGVRDQCAAAQVPWFFKQWGEWAPWVPSDGIDFYDFDKGKQRVYRVGKKSAGHLLDGKEYRETPWSKSGEREPFGSLERFSDIQLWRNQNGNWSMTTEDNPKSLVEGKTIFDCVRAALEKERG